MTEAVPGVMQPQNKEPAEALGRGQEGLCPDSHRERGPTLTLNSDLQPPELWENAFLSGKPSRLRFFVMAALPDQYVI